MLLALSLGLFVAEPAVVPEPAPVQRPSTLPAVEPVATSEPPAIVASPSPFEGSAAAPLANPPAPPPAMVDEEDPLEHRTDGAGWVRIEPPRLRGTGLFVGSAGMLAATGLFQLGDLIICGGCAIGGIEHAFIGTSIALAGGGGHVRGGHDAYYDAALRRQREPRRSLLAGIGLLSAGVAMMIATDVMWFRCVAGGTGPFAGDDYGGCRWYLSRGLLDLSAVTVATGLALTTRGVRLRRDAAIYRHARLVAAPSVNRRGVGLSIGVRF